MQVLPPTHRHFQLQPLRPAEGFRREVFPSSSELRRIIDLAEDDSTIFPPGENVIFRMDFKLARVVTLYIVIYFKILNMSKAAVMVCSSGKGDLFCQDDVANPEDSSGKENCFGISDQNAKYAICYSNINSNTVGDDSNSE